HQHIHRDCQSVRRLHAGGVLKQEYDEDTAPHQYPVQPRQINLPTDFKGISNACRGPELEFHGFVDQCETSGYQCLAGDARRDRCDDDSIDQQPIGHYGVEGYDVAEGLTFLCKQPGALPEIVEQEGSLYEYPASPDIGFTAMPE